MIWVIGNTFPEPSHLLGREDVKWRPILNIYTYRDPSANVVCGKATPGRERYHVKRWVYYYLRHHSDSFPILATIWTGHRNALIARMEGHIVRAHLNIHLTSKRVKTADVATDPADHTYVIASLSECIYQIRPLILVDVLPVNKPSHSGLHFPEKNKPWFFKGTSSDWICCQGLHWTTCAADFNTYTLQVITHSYRAVGRSA